MNGPVQFYMTLKSHLVIETNMSGHFSIQGSQDLRQ